MDEGTVVEAQMARAQDAFRLVYGRWGTLEEEMVEPLIAIVMSEAEALYLDVMARWPGSHVSWEELPMTTDGTGVNTLDSRRLHIVFQGADSGMPDDPTEMRDPIGVAIHSTRAGAEQHAARIEDSGQRPFGLKSLPVDYRRPGWPFSGGPPGPGPMVGWRPS